jgi:hypothetical protein
MDIGSILKESFGLLKAEPKAFIPRLVTTSLYSFFALYSMWLAADIAAAADPRMLPQFVSRTIVLFSMMPALYFIDILSYAMYPRIVEDHRAGRPINLTLALTGGLKAWKTVAALGSLIFAFLVAVVVLSAAAVVAASAAGNPLPIVGAGILVFCLLLLFAILMFFVVPAAVLDGKGVGESFKESIRLGIEHKGGLLKLNAMFMALVIATLAVAYAARADALVSAASLAAFLILRILEAVVYTYLSVSGPFAYMQVRVNNPPGK